MEETTLTERGLSMRNTPEDAARLERKFKSCQKVLTALGDPTRQHLICIMLQQKCSGERVIELARKTNLSRPGYFSPYANPERDGHRQKPEGKDLHLLLSGP